MTRIILGMEQLLLLDFKGKHKKNATKLFLFLKIKSCIKTQSTCNLEGLLILSQTVSPLRQRFTYMFLMSNVKCSRRQIFADRSTEPNGSCVMCIYESLLERVLSGVSCMLSLSTWLCTSGKDDKWVPFMKFTST